MESQLELVKVESGDRATVIKDAVVLSDIKLSDVKSDLDLMTKSVLHPPAELKMEFTPILTSVRLISPDVMSKMVLYSHIFKFTDVVPKTFSIKSRIFWDAYSAKSTQSHKRMWEVKRDTFGFNLSYKTDLEREILLLNIASQIWEHVPVLHAMKKTNASPLYDGIKIWDNSRLQLGYNMESVKDLIDVNETLGRIKTKQLNKKE